MKYVCLFILLFAISCSAPKKDPKNQEQPVVNEEKESKKTVESVIKNTPKEIKQEELLVVLNDTVNIESAKTLITNNNLTWKNLVVNKEQVKIGLIRVPADKKKFWKEKLAQLNGFKSVEENNTAIINRILKESEAVFFKLEKTPCYGECPTYEITIDKNGKVTYIGKEYVLVKGKREFQLTESQFETFKKRLAKRDFTTYNDVYENPNLTDFPSTFVTHKNKRIKIKLWKNVPMDLIQVTEFLDGILLKKKFYE